MTVRITRGGATASDLRRQSGRVKDGRISRRLLAIALGLEGVSRKVAAESCGMDRQTLRDWVHRYNAEGIEGLSNRGGGGVKPLLSEDQMAQLSRWVEAGPDPARDGARWREMASCVGGAWILRGASRRSSMSNSVSVRSVHIWPSWAFAGCQCARNIPMLTRRHRLRSKKLCRYRSVHLA